MVRLGIALDIAGPAIMLLLIIIGAVRAWPYRRSDPQRFTALYKPYKWWGLCIWIACNVAGILLVLSA